MCVPVQVVAAPGARVVLGHEMPVALGSATATALKVTLPEFETAKEYGTVSPSVE